MPTEPISAPRIPRWSDDGEPLPPHVEMVLLLAITAGCIVWLWGAWELVSWLWRLALS